MSLQSGKLPSLGSEDEFFDHKGWRSPPSNNIEIRSFFTAASASPSVFGISKSPQDCRGLGLMCCIPLDNSLRANLTNRNANITQPQTAVSDGGHVLEVSESSCARKL